MTATCDASRRVLHKCYGAPKLGCSIPYLMAILSVPQLSVAGKPVAAKPRFTRSGYVVRSTWFRDFVFLRGLALPSRVMAK